MNKYKKETLQKLGNIETRVSNIEERLQNIEYLIDTLNNTMFAALEKYLKEKFRL